MKPVKEKDQQRSKKNLQKITAGVLCMTFFCGGLLAGRYLFASTSQTDGELAKLETVYEILKNKWFYANQQEDISSTLAEQAITGMTTLEDDPHTNYLSLEQAQAFSQTLSGSSVGIGVSFYQEENGDLYVRQVYINSAAYKAGLQPGDVITAVDDQKAEDVSVDDFVAYIKEHDGKSVDLTVLRDGQEQTITVTPGTFDSTVAANVYGGYGEIVLSSFSENSGKDFADAAAALKNEGATSLIIDLRNNTGGYLSAVLEIASTLLPDDTVVFQEKDADGNITLQTTTKSYAQISFDHIYILQNEYTASASEVLIGALKDNLPEGTVTTIGSTTYGKGTEQVSTAFADGTSLKYTVAEWLTPNGESINLVGFEPDVAVSVDPLELVRYTQMEEGTEILPDTVSTNAAAAQMFLSYLGYSVDRTDGYFSSQSSEALASYQSDKGLSGTGILDAETFQALIGDITVYMNTHDAELDTVRNKALELIEAN